MDKAVRDTIADYREKLEEMGIRVKKIVLFGSHASGRAHEYSDIDLVVISNDFEKMNLLERLTFLGRARTKIRRPMEMLGYTEEEYRSRKRGSFIGDEVKPKGIEVQ